MAANLVLNVGCTTLFLDGLMCAGASFVVWGIIETASAVAADFSWFVSQLASAPWFGQLGERSRFAW
jgi:hypothetical protein